MALQSPLSSACFDSQCLFHYYFLITKHSCVIITLNNGSGRNRASFSKAGCTSFHHWYHEAELINLKKLNAKIIFKMKSLFNRTEFFFWIIIGLRKNPEAEVGKTKIRLPSLWGEECGSHGLHHQQLLDLSSSHQRHGEAGAQSTTHNHTIRTRMCGGRHSQHTMGTRVTKIWQGPSIPTARKSTLLSGPGIRMISPLLQLLGVPQAHLQVYNGGQDQSIIPQCA